MLTATGTNGTQDGIPLKGHLYVQVEINWEFLHPNFLERDNILRLKKYLTKYLKYVDIRHKHLNIP